MTFGFSKMLADQKFRKTVGVSRSKLQKLAQVLLEREDDEAQCIVLRDGTAGEIFGTRFETVYVTVAVTASYNDSSKFVVCVLDLRTEIWGDVLLSSDWERSFKAGPWQEVVKSLVDHFVTAVKK